MPAPLRALTAVAVLTAALAGCGGGGPPPPSPAAEARAVRATLARFAQAVGRGDVGLICTQLLDPKLVAQINEVGLSCPAALRRGFGAAKRPQLTVEKVTVRGETAQARVLATAANQPATTTTLDLVKIDGRWRVTSLGPAGPGPTQRGVPNTPGAGPGGGGD